MIEHRALEIGIMTYMQTQVIFLEGLNRFSSAEKNQLKKVVDRTSKDAIKLLDIKNPVIFTVFKQGKIVNAYTASSDWIRITIPENKFLVKELEAVIYHEMNHVARGYSEFKNRMKGISLLDAVIAEGLGTYFEMSKVSGIPFRHGKYKIEQLKKRFKDFKHSKNDKNYNHFEWFFGEGNKPNQFGYKMGKYIIDQVLQHHPEISIKNLTTMPSAKIWKLSKIVLK